MIGKLFGAKRLLCHAIDWQIFVGKMLIGCVAIDWQIGSIERDGIGAHA